MRAFLEKIEKDYLDDFVFVSKYQLQNLDIEVIDFDGLNLSSLDKYKPNLKTDIIIGSVEATNYFFNLCGSKIPSYLGYPNELKKYLGRTVFSTQVKDLSLLFPYFIKPKDDVKLFTGTLVENEKQLKIFKEQYPVTSETKLFLSSPVKFISEYRCFVHKGVLKGIQWYSGDFKIFPDVSIIENMIKDFKNAPVSYTIDVGVINDTDKYLRSHLNTLLVEINDMWAIGSYGFSAKDYVRMTIDRFQEINKNNIPIHV